MSIINDALKKTQRKMQNKNQKQLSAKSFKAKATAVEQTRSSSWLRYSGLTLVFAAILAAIAISLYYNRQALSRLPLPSLTSNHPQKHNAVAPSNLVLRGTMLQGQKRVAFINHQTYRVGDSVDGYKITNISMYKVVLENASGKVSLSTMAG